MKALTVRQPWAWAILHAGKGIENRSWATDYRGPLLVHASKGMTRQQYEDAEDSIWVWAPHVRLPKAAELERGGIVGIANLAFITASPDELVKCNPWEAPTGFAYRLTDAHPLPFAACRGQLGLWEVPTDVVARTGIGALRHFDGGWETRHVSTRAEDRALPGLLEWRDAPAGADSLWEVRPTAFGLAVRDALGGGRA